MFNLDTRWTVRHFRQGKLIWEIVDKKNGLVLEGAKCFLETIFRDRASNYFGDTDFFIGMYNGTVSSSTVLATVPGEPSGNGYSRQRIERSVVGWPTLEINEGNWRIVSKEVTLTASGGNIGPVQGAFLGTSEDNTGTLISYLAFGVERTILSGDTITMQIKDKMT